MRENQANGTFEVSLTTQSDAASEDPMLARHLIDKTFHGDLQGKSVGQMLSAGTTVPGSAGYVAIEKVHGSLRGRTGSFVLQHSGTMTRGEPRLDLTVVPDSGTDELTGLEGEMSIDLDDGKHSYRFSYSLPG